MPKLEKGMAKTTLYLRPDQYDQLREMAIHRLLVDSSAERLDVSALVRGIIDLFLKSKAEEAKQKGKKNAKATRR